MAVIKEVLIKSAALFAYPDLIRASLIKATPHRDCRPIASPNFSSDCTKSTNNAGAYEEILGKNDGKFASKRAAKPVGRSLCGVALNKGHL